MPQYVTEKVIKKIKNQDFKDIEKLEKKGVREIVRKKAETIVDKTIKFPTLSLEQKLNSSEGYKKAHKEAMEKIYRQETKQDKKIISDALDATRKKIKGEYEAYSLGVDSKELRPRTNNLRLVMSDKSGNAYRTYKDNGSEIFGTYLLSSANFTANARVAPEYLKHFWEMGEGTGKVESALNNLEISYRGNPRKKKDAQYVKDVLGELIGTEQSNAWRWLRNLSHTVSMAGLSGLVEPGVKNFFLGQTMIIATHGTRDYVKALWSLAGNEKWNKADD